MVIVPTSAQDESKAQIIDGYLALGEKHLYMLPGLKQGDTLSIYVEGISGNLDPTISLAATSIDPKELSESFYDDVYAAIEEGRDPLVAIPELKDEYLLAWDDDSGLGYNAALSFRVPEDGDYLLMVASNITVDSFGDYRLTIGVNAPIDLQTGKATPTGDTIAFLDKSSNAGYAVQEVFGNLSGDRNLHFFNKLCSSIYEIRTF